MIFLALAGFSEFSSEEKRQFWWFMLLMATILPACLTLVGGAWWDPIFLTLGLTQGAAMIFLLRAILRFLRRRAYKEISTVGIMAAAYFPVCLATNGLWLLGFIYSPRLR